MPTSDCHFIVLDKIKYPLVNQFYKRIYKKGIANKSEAVFVLKNSQGIICSAKLKSLDKELLLTGVACDPQYQQQGYASKLITTLLNMQKQKIYCFPYPHLEQFYLRLGFTPLIADNAPSEIQQRFLHYQKHQKLLLMLFK